MSTDVGGNVTDIQGYCAYEPQGAQRQCLAPQQQQTRDYNGLASGAETSRGQSGSV